MLDTTLYRKVMKGKRVSYEAVPTQSAKLDEGMTAGEIITAVGTLGVLCINGYQEMLPEKSCLANRVQRVKDAVLKMFEDTGVKTDTETIKQVCTVWNKTMQALDGQ